MYVTVSQFKEHSYVDTEAGDDAYIKHLLSVAESSVSKFLQRPLSELETDGTDEDGKSTKVLPPDVTHAILLRAADLYENRESLAPSQIHVVPGTYYELLAPYRKVGSWNK